jgi:uncharacterized protein involved in type VI secretion and phage assembly
MGAPAADHGLHTEKRYHGKYRGLVSNTDDPRRLRRVKVRVPEVTGLDIETDWAWTQQGSGGGADRGSFLQVSVNDSVFVEFESGDINRPVVTGHWWGHPEGSSPEAPALTRSDGSTCYSTDPSVGTPKGTDGFVAADGSNECQPPSTLLTAGGPEYPNNSVFKTKNNGVTIEVDDTPGRPRVQVYMGEDSGSWLEFDGNGLSVRVNGRAYKLVEQDESTHVKGSQHTAAEENLTHKAGAERWLSVGGNETRLTQGTRDTFVNGEENKVSQANYTETILGNKTSVIVGNSTEIVLGQKTTEVFGVYSILAGGVLTLGGASVSIGAGSPTSAAPEPLPPPVFPPEPTCPPIPPAPPCPPLPSS